MKKSITTQELVNIYPPWSKVRSDDQSVGYQLLNAIAQPMERMDKQLSKMRDNQYLATFNLDEIDLTYKVALPTTFTFSYDSTDPIEPFPVAPTVQGSVDGIGYVNVSVADGNDVQSFWYDAVPTRASNDLVASGEFVLLDQDVDHFPWSGILTHHLADETPGGGKIWVEAIGGTQYVTVSDRKEVNRATVILHGVTRKGTVEDETMVFPWDEKKASVKEWKRLTSIDVFNMESGVNLEVRSADFNSPPYWSHYNLRFSEKRTKVDEFWELGEDNDTIERVGFVSDSWQDVILGFSEKEAKEEWELLDAQWNTVTAVDMAIQPYSDRAWVLTSAGKLHCYSLDEVMVSGVDYLQPRTAGADVEIMVEKKRVVLGDFIEFTPWHARPLKELQRYRVWYQEPGGTKYGLLDGSPVAYSSDFWVYGQQLKRVITDTIQLTASQRGEYLLVLEAEFIDDTVQVDRVIVSVQYKLPLVTLDLINTVPTPVAGLDFDADQRLWIRTSDFYYRLKFHYDVMLVDYTGKILYFREPYDDVRVTV